MSILCIVILFRLYIERYMTTGMRKSTALSSLNCLKVIILYSIRHTWIETSMPYNKIDSSNQSLLEHSCCLWLCQTMKKKGKVHTFHLFYSAVSTICKSSSTLFSLSTPLSSHNTILWYTIIIHLSTQSIVQKLLHHNAPVSRHHILLYLSNPPNAETTPNLHSLTPSTHSSKPLTILAHP